MKAAGYGYHHSSDDGVFTLWAMVLVPLPLEMRITLSVPLNCPPSKLQIRLTVLSTISPTVAELEQTVKAGGTISLLIWQMRSKKKSTGHGTA